MFRMPSVRLSENLQQRTASAIVMLVVTVGILWLGGWWLTAAVMLAAIQLHREWEVISPQQNRLWSLIGILYIMLPSLSLLKLRSLAFMAGESYSFWMTLFPLVLVMVTDIGGYVFGKAIGGPKLAPLISPGKTWSGLVGAVLFCVLLSTSVSAYLPWPFTFMGAVFLGISVALLAQAGDLLESSLKRASGVKDSGNLLPGHGGLLDRLDGYVFVLPFYLLMLIIYAEVI